MKTYHVITEPTGWSFIIDRLTGMREGPYRYRWEADEAADEMNAKVSHDHDHAQA